MLTSRLKEARLRAGLSQERLGTLAGLDEMSASSRMNQYERGKHTPGFFLIERLAQALNMPTPWFYTRDDDMAELLLAYNALPADLREKALSYVRELARANGKGDGAEAAAGAADAGAATDSGTPVAPGTAGASADQGSTPQGGDAQGEPAGPATYSRSSPGQSQNRTPAPPPSADGRSRK
ncbi:hypothetical protein AKI39_18915 [Bordetella sp. H567]|uniref:helix-turn-helix domain-containing protein n=1 Tax=Bordetella sp. H567 TaxID=1697043 RepID=UPI00081D2488|nr:helix-turn-helix transcriptional regulator [Bordetella sp. H567]AOB32348.1 hypothetical protein AKI39_18915 [Bordetella sp. H567]